MPYEDEIPPYVEPDTETNELSSAVIGAAIEVHRRLGAALDEALYAAALRIEFELRAIPFECEVVIDVDYKGRKIGSKRLDFIVGKKLSLELKAVEDFAPVHKAQLHTYLKITGFKLGLLLNFNTAVLKDGIKRVVRA